MADSYIDYLEVGEYGDYFVTECKRLIGAHAIVDMEAIRALVADAVARMDAELLATGVRRSEARLAVAGADAVMTRARRSVDYFWSYLAQLDEAVVVDVAVFFKGGRKGNLSGLKPADLLKRVDEILRGFEAPAHAALPEAQDWKTRLSGDREALYALVNGSQSTRAESIVATAGLTAARDHFLKVYNRVAKPATRALLAVLGREGEYRLFFKDLQVTESRPAPAPAAPPEPTSEPVA